MFIYALSCKYYAYVCLLSNLCHVILKCQYRHTPSDTPFFLFLSRQPLLFGLSTAQYHMHVFSNYIFFGGGGLTFVFHIPTASCVSQLLKF